VNFSIASGTYQLMVEGIPVLAQFSISVVLQIEGCNTAENYS